MTPPDRVRAAALVLPQVREEEADGVATFSVEGAPFARLRDDALLAVRDGDDGRWNDIRLDGEPDWPLIEDRIARSWELAAPRRLLEAGGR